MKVPTEEAKMRDYSVNDRSSSDLPYCVERPFLDDPGKSVKVAHSTL